MNSHNTIMINFIHFELRYRLAQSAWHAPQSMALGKLLQVIEELKKNHNFINNKGLLLWHKEQNLEPESDTGIEENLSDKALLRNSSLKDTRPGPTPCDKIKDHSNWQHQVPKQSQ